MKVGVLYDQGSSQYREDGLYAGTRIFGVADGVSAPYNKWNPPMLFDGQTGGEMVARVFERKLALTDRDGFAGYGLAGLPNMARDVNFVVGEIQKGRGLSLDCPEDLAGATFAMVWVTEHEVEIIQAGDCFALWVTTGGGVGITTNQVRRHDTAMNALILNIQREIAAERGLDLESVDDQRRGEIRTEMWRQFYEPLKAARREDVNNPKSQRGYGLLNGQLALEQMWFHGALPRAMLKTVLLFSDGMVPWERMKDQPEVAIAKEVYQTFTSGGLSKVLGVARGIEEATKASSYANAAEATAISIEF
ncbi:MAG: hypothetical protein Q8Q41_05010 [bacterium]|nr:hypothetical protein [bacterium]